MVEKIFSKGFNLIKNQGNSNSGFETILFWSTNENSKLMILNKIDIKLDYY